MSTNGFFLEENQRDRTYVITSPNGVTKISYEEFSFLRQCIVDDYDRMAQENQDMRDLLRLKGVIE